MRLSRGSSEYVSAVALVSIAIAAGSAFALAAGEQARALIQFISAPSIDIELSCRTSHSYGDVGFYICIVAISSSGRVDVEILDVRLFLRSGGSKAYSGDELASLGYVGSSRISVDKGTTAVSIVIPYSWTDPPVSASVRVSAGGEVYGASSGS